MGLIRCVRNRIYVEGESSVDRIRKDIVGVAFPFLGTFSLLGATTAAIVRRPGSEISSAGLLVLSISFLSVSLYVATTRRITRTMCEVTAAPLLVGAMMIDLSFTLRGESAFMPCIVVLLDVLLLTDCSDAVTRAVLYATAAWLAVTAVLRVEGVRVGEQCSFPARWSGAYLSATFNAWSITTVVLAVDFYFTRGFAKAMREQKALVEASIQATERATVLLSNYETSKAQELLEGPEAQGLPEGLRAALLQLVANLAVYRPLLPHSCLQPADSESSSDAAVPTETESEPHPRHSSRSDSAVGTAAEAVAGSLVRKSSAALGAAANRRPVSLAAANVTSFSAAAQAAHTSAVTVFLHVEVNAFLCATTAESGVVDLISGDHMYASFNASRLCTTHRGSAARVAWEMASRAAEGTASSMRGLTQRTGCACSGQVLCGEFGSAELRRFMVLGPVVNATLCLERVASQNGAVLADDAVGRCADVLTCFFTQLVERVVFAKSGPRPFLLWRLRGKRETGGGPAEWMYELERQQANPFEDWNNRLHAWLGDAEGDAAPLAPPTAALNVREQSRMVEATVVGGSVALEAAARHAELSSLSLQPA
eukprot:TRINITY_DN3224_c0_g2_i1.p1 TRINITY_DN3224_c0_g2~~TRINITY_DN3224_c0_g2_i1.p1  ORF type:complete len:597 (+),score=206.18 TRINITY_DN3224_c0_g2_i1:58-1848(+)